MASNYDVMILDTGEAGIYAAYELALRHHVRLWRRGGEVLLRPDQTVPRAGDRPARLLHVGDGAGVTRGLAQAGASGVKAARAAAARLGQ